MRGGAFTILSLSFIPLHYLCESTNLKVPMYFFNISSGLAFYTFGYLFRKKSLGIFATSIVVTLYVIMTILFPTTVDMRSGNLVRGEYLLWIPYSILGILALNSIGKLIANRKNILSEIGKDTMPYYCMHWCIIVVVSIFFEDLSTPNRLFLTTAICANVIFLPLLTNIIYKSPYKKIFG